MFGGRYRGHKNKITMSTTELKSTLHTLVDGIDDAAVLQAYVILLSRGANSVADFWEGLDNATKMAIEEGINDLNNGRKSNFFDFMKTQYGI
jgi:hypothetical protein